jgi:amidohydrolase
VLYFCHIMTALLEKVKQLAKQHHNDVIAIRRHIHANPELSFQEHNTSAFIASKLEEYGIPYTKGIAGTGIVAIIEGKDPASKVIALRADMDALPIHEENKKEYVSKNPGVMHACGHDVHSASLLGAARILKELCSELTGTVKLIFQPGEEQLPGGASIMIKEGVLDNPRPQNIFAQHVFPSMEAGKVGLKSGMYMASTDELYVTVKGKGGHAAMPAHYTSPLIIASAILLGLQKEFMDKDTRTIPNVPTVLAFGKITGMGATNVIPDEVMLEGTFRTMDEKWRAEAHQRMKSMAEKIAVQMGGSCEFRVEHGYPFLVNDHKATAHARAAAEEYLGKENVEELELRMTAEDFSYYSQVVPACFYRLGTGNKEKGITSGVHTSTFDIDERALETGSGLMAWIVLKELAAK